MDCLKMHRAQQLLGARLRRPAVAAANTGQKTLREEAGRRVRGQEQLRTEFKKRSLKKRSIRGSEE